MNANDPRLTAHALGEADAESADFIAHDPALAAESAQIARFAAQLRAELHAEPSHPLRAEQRAALLAAATVVTGPARWWQRSATLGAAAACVVLALGATIYFQARHVNALRPIAGAEKTAAQSVNVRWAGENAQQRAEPVLAPKTAIEARPSYASPSPELVRMNEPAKLPATKPTVENLPTLIASSTPAPIKVDPTTVPMNGTRPAAPEPTNAAPLRLGTKPPGQR